MLDIFKIFQRDKPKNLLTKLKVPLPKMVNGPWIMGGAARQFYETGDFHNCNDIDYFFRSRSQFNKYSVKFKKITNGWFKTDGLYSIMSSYPDPNLVIEIQKTRFNLVGFNFAPTAEELVRCFDFTVCQFWTDGITAYSTDQAREDAKNKILRFTTVSENVISNMIIGYGIVNNLVKIEERIKKYRDKGFNPNEEMIEFIIKYL